MWAMPSLQYGACGSASDSQTTDAVRHWKAAEFGSRAPHNSMWALLIDRISAEG